MRRIVGLLGFVAVLAAGSGHATERRSTVAVPGSRVVGGTLQNVTTYVVVSQAGEVKLSSHSLGAAAECELPRDDVSAVDTALGKVREWAVIAKADKFEGSKLLYPAGESNMVVNRCVLMFSSTKAGNKALVLLALPRPGRIADGTAMIVILEEHHLQPLKSALAEVPDLQRQAARDQGTLDKMK